MGIQNIVKSAGQSLTGNIEKAIIEIEDHRVNKGDITVTETEARKSTTAGLSQISEKLSDVANNVAENVSSASDKLPFMKEVNKLKEKAAESTHEKKRFEVKFNPSQISFQAMGGGKVEKRDYGVKDQKDSQNVQVTYQEMHPRIQMNLQLVFDDYERTQAFMLEKMTDVTAMARTGISGIVNAATGRSYSVRSQVEGFVGALRNSRTRKVTFYWGKMKYHGDITHINAEYTMFSTDGNPIRANVNMGILLVDETLDYQSMGPWQYSYQKVFGRADETNLGNAVQNVGNIFNFNL